MKDWLIRRGGKRCYTLENDKVVSVYLYLVDFREEATPYELCAEILPEMPFAGTDMKAALVLGLAVRICTLTEEGGSTRLRHAHIRYPCDSIYKA